MKGEDCDENVKTEYPVEICPDFPMRWFFWLRGPYYWICLYACIDRTLLYSPLDWALMISNMNDPVLAKCCNGSCIYTVSFPIMLLICFFICTIWRTVFLWIVPVFWFILIIDLLALTPKVGGSSHTTALHLQSLEQNVFGECYHGQNIKSYINHHRKSLLLN